MRARIAELEAQLLADTTKPPKGTEELAQGDEQHSVAVTFIARDPNDHGYDHPSDIFYEVTITATWNDIFAAVAPAMINEATDREVRNEFKEFFAGLTRKTFSDDKKLKGRHSSTRPLRMRRLTHASFSSELLD